MLRGLFGRGAELDAHSSTGTQAALDLADIQGFILRGYRMPMVRHFLLTVDVPVEARKLLGRFISGDEADAPQILLPRTGMLALSRDPQMILPKCRAVNPTIASTLASPGTGLVALEVKDRVPTL